MLLTGSTGFLGSNLQRLLSGAFDIDGLGRTDTATVKCDLATQVPALPGSYDTVVHCAGAAHDDGLDFIGVNFMGTVNLCKALDAIGKPLELVFISSVSVYGVEAGLDIPVTAKRLGRTDYAKSKILAEDYLATWCASRGVILTILRPALIVGDNPKGLLGAMERAIRKGRYFRVGKGDALKSITTPESIAVSIKRLSPVGGIYNVCEAGPVTVKALEEMIVEKYGGKKIHSIPAWLARMLARIGDHIPSFPIDSHRLAKLTTSLTFVP